MLTTSHNWLESVLYLPLSTVGWWINDTRIGQYCWSNNSLTKKYEKVETERKKWTE